MQKKIESLSRREFVNAKCLITKITNLQLADRDNTIMFGSRPRCSLIDKDNALAEIEAKGLIVIGRVRESSIINIISVDLRGLQKFAEAKFGTSLEPIKEENSTLKI